MILLDTHVVIWMIESPKRISRAATEAINNAGSAGALPSISVVSLYELIYAMAKGRVQFQLPSGLLAARLREWFDLRPITENIAFEAATIAEPFHGDPMDRLIAATAIVEGCTLITRDERIRSANVCRTLW